MTSTINKSKILFHSKSYIQHVYIIFRQFLQFCIMCKLFEVHAIKIIKLLVSLRKEQDNNLKWQHQSCYGYTLKIKSNFFKAKKIKMFSRYDWSWLADWKLEQNTHSLQSQFNSYDLFKKNCNEICVKILIEFLIKTKMYKLKIKLTRTSFIVRTCCYGNLVWTTAIDCIRATSVGFF